MMKSVHMFLSEKVGVEGEMDRVAWFREFVRWERGEVTVEEVNQVVRVVVENKLMGDKDVNDLIGFLSLAVSGKTVSAVEEEVATEGVVDDSVFEAYAMRRNAAGLFGEKYLDSLDEEFFSQIELEAWKQNTQPKYHRYIDEIGARGLMNMKMLFTDFFGDPFTPRGRQRWTLANLRRWTTIVSSRRGGKTYFGAYLCARQLYLPNQTIVYVVPTLRNQAGTPFRYLEMFFGDDPEVQFDRNNWTIRHKKLKSEIIFISAERDTNVRSQAANLIIYDEAAFISEKVYETASALVRTTQGMVYIISTVNPDTPKNWFYYKLIEAEIEMFNAVGEVNSLARRVTLHDNPFIDDREKEAIIKDGQRNPKLFGAEWMCEFQESDVFDLKNFWRIDYSPVEKMFGDLRTIKLHRSAVFSEVSG